MNNKMLTPSTIATATAAFLIAITATPRVVARVTVPQM
jgi:hypothetical protein